MSPMVTHSPKIALVSRQNCSVRLCGAATDDKLWKSFPFIQVHPTIPANTSQHLSTAEPPVRMFLRCLRRKPRPTLIAVSKYDMIRKGRTWTNVTKLCLRFRKMSCGNVWPCDPIKLNLSSSLLHSIGGAPIWLWVGHPLPEVARKIPFTISRLSCFDTPLFLWGSVAASLLPAYSQAEAAWDTAS